MADQSSRAQQFATLHKKGDPIIIYNVWDGGSAKAVAAAGAKALATGDHPVGFAHGFDNDDFDDFTFDIYFATIKEIAMRAGDLPFSVDISNAEGLDETGLKERIRSLLEIGVIGVNFEDRLPDSSGVLPADEQAARIRTIRTTADEFGVPLFINARTDLFSTAGDTAPADLIDDAIARSKTYKDAGGSGFFAPGLMDIELIKKLADESPLPINIIRLPGTPGTKDLASAGVSRISYGPVPQMQMTEWLTAQAKKAIDGEI